MDLHSLRAAARIVVGGLLFVFLYTVVYVAAFHAPRAKGIDVGVVGTPAQAAQVQGALDATSRGAFDVRRYGTEARARAALLDTDVHGVAVLGGANDRILVASALGVAPTQSVIGALRGVVRARPAIDDVRPLPSGDRRGLASLFTVLGTVMPSLAFGVLLALTGRGLPRRARHGAVLAFAVLGGIVVAFDVDVVTGALDGDFAGIAVVAGLLALAVAATAHGLARAGGRAGIAVAAVTLLLFGISSTGGAVTYEYEPGFYGAISQLLPPGAALTAVRNVRYFGWADTLAPLLVLGSWGAGGLALGLAAERLGRLAVSPVRPGADAAIVGPVVASARTEAS